jgi:outer membrane lipoprotein-sorting protein
MTTAARVRLAGALALLAFPLLVSAQAQAPSAAPKASAAALPPAAEILKHYRVAIGGEAAIKRHTSRTMTGTFEISGQGMKGDLTIVAQAPDKMRLSITLQGLGDMERGYDGHVGWSVDPAVGPRLLQGRELDELRHSADFYDDLHDPSRYRSVTVLSQEPFEGQECYEVKLVRTSGFEYTEFFSVKTGLMVGVKMEASSQMGTVPVTSIVTEYKAFGGVLMPTITRQKMMGLESVTTVSNVTFDPVAPNAFDLPPAIAALIRQQK